MPGHCNTIKYIDAVTVLKYDIEVLVLYSSISHFKLLYTSTALRLSDRFSSSFLCRFHMNRKYKLANKLGCIVLNKAFQSYQSRGIDTAICCVFISLSLSPGDVPSRQHTHRCITLKPFQHVISQINKLKGGRSAGAISN